MICVQTIISSHSKDQSPKRHSLNSTYQKKKSVVQSCSITKCSLYLQNLTWHLKKEPWHTRFLLQTYHFGDLLMYFFSGVYQLTWKLDSNIGRRKKKTWLSIDKNGLIPSRKSNTSPLENASNHGNPSCPPKLPPPQE